MTFGADCANHGNLTEVTVNSLESGVLLREYWQVQVFRFRFGKFFRGGSAEGVFLSFCLKNGKREGKREVCWAASSDKSWEKRDNRYGCEYCLERFSAYFNGDVCGRWYSLSKSLVLKLGVTPSPVSFSEKVAPRSSTWDPRGMFKSLEWKRGVSETRFP